MRKLNPTAVAAFVQTTVIALSLTACGGGGDKHNSTRDRNF